MSDTYTTDNMSAETRVICERGKFFIETGTTTSFKKFIQNSTKKIVRYMPTIWLGRIGDLIDEGDVDGAVFLWTQICKEVDVTLSNRRYVLFFYISYFLIACMAIYTFLKVV